MAANPRFFRIGESIFKEGEPSRSLFLVKRGTIAIRKKQGQGFAELAKVYSNEILGELSFFDRQPRSAGAVALTEVEVVEIPFDSLAKVYGTIPDYIRAMMTAMAERLRRADEMIRKLQKEAQKFETPGESNPTAGEEPDAASVLAATALSGSASSLANESHEESSEESGAEPSEMTAESEGEPKN